MWRTVNDTMVAKLLFGLAFIVITVYPAYSQTCGFEEGVDYHNGQGIGSAAAASAQDCCAQCLNATWVAKGCKYWTYTKATGEGNECWFKETNDGRTNRDDRTSGPVPTPPSPPTPPPAPTPPTTPPPPTNHHQTAAATLSIGSILLIATCGTTLLYFGMGVAVNKKRGSTGRDLVPNLQFWGSLPGLIKDGCGFFRHKVVKREATPYSAYENL
eukprot:m.104783 g.104783  ORF g.104783 m.104783 type:complete len:214 (+) comp27594_c0_seq3:359-1000(+)